MTAQNLIAILRLYPADAEVVIDHANFQGENTEFNPHFETSSINAMIEKNGKIHIDVREDMFRLKGL